MILGADALEAVFVYYLLACLFSPASEVGGVMGLNLFVLVTRVAVFAGVCLYSCNATEASNIGACTYDICVPTAWLPGLDEWA